MKTRKFDKSFIPIRLNLLFGVVIVLFVSLIARLGYMQVINQQFYTKKISTASTKQVTSGSVRGQIYDAGGRPLVENITKQVVSFTRSNQMTRENIKNTAKKLADVVNISDIHVSDRDQIDYYLADREVYFEVVSNLPDNKKFDTNGNLLSETSIYKNAVSSVPIEMINYTNDEKKAIHLFAQMNKVANFETGNLVTDDLSVEQIAILASSSKDIPGVSVTTNWVRKVLDTSLASIVGTVSSEQTGLPVEEAKDYLEKGYSFNDRVGTSYLEKEYESILQGERSIKEIHLNKHGNIESIRTISNGRKGNNLRLTIDLNFQDGVEHILKRSFDSELVSGDARYSEGVYAVALNPKTGAVLALAGVKHDIETGEVTSDSLGTVTNVFVPGSVVKAATLTAGWKLGVISGNQVLVDHPIWLDDTTSISSWFTRFGSRSITAVEALEYSSNVYMVQIALRLLGQSYDLDIDVDKLKYSMTQLRETFSQYGLGTRTGVDLPIESSGFVPEEFTFGNYLAATFGQFDNYTTLQLAQYAATVANDGIRLAPHLVEGVYDNDEQGRLGQLLEKTAVRELNRVEISIDNMALLKEGFYRVVNGNSSLTTGRIISRGSSVPISAKTGTAETFVITDAGQVKQAINTNVVAYAPSGNPQIAVAVVFPHTTKLSSTVSHSIASAIINLYNQQHPMN